MSILVEVESTEKNCLVIINLEHIIEIAPLVAGGCELRLMDNRIMKVKDDYTQFKQFVMQTVTSEMISERIGVIQESAKPKSGKKSSSTDDLVIPVFNKA